MARKRSRSPSLDSDHYSSDGARRRRLSLSPRLLFASPSYHPSAAFSSNRGFPHRRIFGPCTPSPSASTTEEEYYESDQPSPPYRKMSSRSQRRSRRERTPLWSLSTGSESEYDDDCSSLVPSTPASSSASDDTGRRRSYRRRSPSPLSDDTGRRSYRRRSLSPLSHDRWCRRRSPLPMSDDSDRRCRRRSPSPMYHGSWSSRRSPRPSPAPSARRERTPSPSWYRMRSPSASPVSHQLRRRRSPPSRPISRSPRYRMRSPIPPSFRIPRRTLAAPVCGRLPSPGYPDLRLRHGRKTKKSLYLILPDSLGDQSGYAVHRIDVAHSRRGISITGEELTEPPVTRFRSAPGMDFIKVGLMIVGVTGKDGGADDAASVLIDARSWEVSTGPAQSSVKYGIVELDGKVYHVDMFCKDPRFEVLGRARAGAGVTWSPLSRPPFRSRIVSLAAHHSSYRRGLLVSTEDHETYLFNVALAAWEKLRGEPLPFEERAVHTADYLWLATSPADGRLRAHDINVVDDGFTTDDPPSVRCDTYRIHDPIPITTPGARDGGAAAAAAAGTTTRTVYLGGGRFAVVQAAAGDADRVVVTVTVFKVLDSDVSWGRRRERGMGAKWVASELQTALYSRSHRGKHRKICRLNLWSRTFVVVGGGGGRRGPYLAAALWM